MRIFVIGASGYIGHAVALAFRSKGHTVFGLVRSQEQASELSQHEIWPVMGDLQNPQSFLKTVDDVEVVVNCAFDYAKEGIERDSILIDLITSTLTKSHLPRTFIYTSGIWIYGSRGTQIVDEASPLKPLNVVTWRPSHEEKVLKATSGNLRTVVMRPGFVYGNQGGLLKVFYEAAQKGFVPYIGDGQNHWPMVHVDDLAHAYVSAAEKEVSGVTLNIVDDSTPTLKEIAEAIAESAGIPGKVKSVTQEEFAKDYFPKAEGIAINLRVDNSRIKRLLHWQIHHAPFINEVKSYYHAWQATTMVASK